MNAGLYEILFHLSEVSGFTLDECLAYGAMTLMVFFVAFGFSILTFTKVGFFLGDMLDDLFRAILRRIRRKKDEGP